MVVASSPTVVEVSSGPAAWIAIAAAIIATFGTIIAAIVAARSAKADKKSELQAQHISELENRISERKYEIYKPMVEMLGKVISANIQPTPMTPGEVVSTIHQFSVWIGIYGSDDAVIAFHKFAQAAYNGVPGEVATRLYAELVLATRRDIARSDTRIGAVEIIGMRVSDLYTNAEYYRTMTDPFDEVCRRNNWTPPWSLPDSDEYAKQSANSSDEQSISSPTAPPSS
jgi:hypothetical protein